MLSHAVPLTEKTPKKKKEEEEEEGKKKTQDKEGGRKINFATPPSPSYPPRLEHHTAHKLFPNTQLAPKVGAWDGQGAHETLTKLEVSGEKYSQLTLLTPLPPHLTGEPLWPEL